MPGFIIVGYVWRILGAAPIREQPRKSPSWIGLKTVISFWNKCLQVYSCSVHFKYSSLPHFSGEIYSLAGDFLKPYEQKLNITDFLTNRDLTWEVTWNFATYRANFFHMSSSLTSIFFCHVLISAFIYN